MFRSAAIMVLLFPLLAFAGSIEKAKELTQLTNVKKMTADMGPAMADMMYNNMRSVHPNLPPEARDALRQVVSESFIPVMNEMMDNAVKLYADNLTDADLDAAIGFYRTEAGQHILQKMPVIMQQMIQQSQPTMAKHMPEMQARIQEEFKKRNIQVN
jgi:hypothetical protein